jgi:hypothetical protein
MNLRKSKAATHFPLTLWDIFGIHFCCTFLLFLVNLYTQQVSVRRILTFSIPLLEQLNDMSSAAL